MILQIVAGVIGYFLIGIVCAMIEKWDFNTRFPNGSHDDMGTVICVLAWPFVIVLLIVTLIFIAISSVVMFCVDFGDRK